MQVPILSGIVADGADFRSAYPLNLIPVAKEQGISKGYLRPADGIVTVADGGGRNRGGVRWRDKHYRVMAGKLLRIDADDTVTEIGAIPGTNWCTFAASFTHLAINADGKLFLYDGTTLAQVTDVDLGASLDVEWINGYFVSTDGEYIVTTDISDPFSVNPLRYASSEISPDPIVCLLTLRNEIYAINRYTIEVFGAVVNPGSEFPFARIDGAQIMRGAVGSRAACEFVSRVAFVGSAEGQPPAVWLGGGGDAEKLSTPEIDDALRSYSDADLAAVVVEAREDFDHNFLYVHLPDQTFVYDGPASQALGIPVWFVLRSFASGYRARGFVWCYGRWNVADPFGALIGYLSPSIGSHYGVHVPWEFTTPIVYNEGKGAILHELELVALTGEVALGDDPLIATSYTLDGRAWSQPRYIRAGRQGERAKRLVWDRQGSFGSWRAQRFLGDSRAHLSFARLEAQVEALAV